MLLDADKTAHELSQRGLAWADADAAFRALDDVTKSVMSEIMGGYNNKDSMASKEMRARYSTKFLDHLDVLATARKAALIAKVNLETYKCWMEMMRTNAATERVQMGLL